MMTIIGSEYASHEKTLYRFVPIFVATFETIADPQDWQASPWTLLRTDEKAFPPTYGKNKLQLLIIAGTYILFLTLKRKTR
jgi:hypothetical protein